MLFRGLAGALAAAALGIGCAQPAPAPVVAPAPAAAPAVPDAGAAASPPASEVEARGVLAARFRGAGLRILADVRVELPGGGEVTLDGFDPDRRIGFEYVAAGEADTDLSASERESLEAGIAGRVLVVDAAPAAVVDERAAAFVATWAAADAGL